MRQAQWPPGGPSCTAPPPRGTWSYPGREEAENPNQGISRDQKGQGWRLGAGAGRIWRCRFPLGLIHGFRILFEVKESEALKQV